MHDDAGVEEEEEAEPQHKKQKEGDSSDEDEDLFASRNDGAAPGENIYKKSYLKKSRPSQAAVDKTASPFDVTAVPDEKMYVCCALCKKYRLTDYVKKGTSFDCNSCDVPCDWCVAYEEGTVRGKCDKKKYHK